MKYTAILIVLFTLLSCNGNPEEQIPHLDGYWEIKRVERDGETVVEYRFNENVDFFEIDSMKGIRKKVKPQIDGTYLVTDDSENVEVKIEDDLLYIYYTTAYDSWREKVNTLTTEKLELENEDGIIYHYERYTSLLNNYDETE